MKVIESGILFFSIKIYFSNPEKEGYSGLSETWQGRGIEITTINDRACLIEVHLWRSKISTSPGSFLTLNEEDRSLIINDLYSAKRIEKFYIRLFETTSVPGRLCLIYSFKNQRCLT